MSATIPTPSSLKEVRKHRKKFSHSEHMVALRTLAPSEYDSSFSTPPSFDKNSRKTSKYQTKQEKNYIKCKHILGSIMKGMMCMEDYLSQFEEGIIMEDFSQRDLLDIFDIDLDIDVAEYIGNMEEFISKKSQLLQYPDM